MPGLSLNTGLTGSVFSNGYPGYAAGAAVPAASTVPEGPSSITQMAYGVPGNGPGGRKGLTAAAVSTLALAVLGFIWWSLPR